ncbi:serine/threonine protein kinase [Stieleria sp. TO1_6]|uniref:WD40 repeat domain-containing serine/threonine protein kinase n=1 Tax=Stieleria tagensis TaxID=2956795 RepID=UPI00209BB7CC|nr:serine/threonine-protein kinase [Stieleria tagensis]MCO8123758.1 serine/threonine protein kinase [Stieleria tagensis]
MSVTTCPTPAELEALISGVMPAAKADETTEHVGGCTRCQDAMDSVSSAQLVGLGGASLGEVSIEDLVGRQVIAPPAGDSAYWQAVTKLTGEFAPAGTNDSGDSATKIGVAEDAATANNDSGAPAVRRAEPQSEPVVPASTQPTLEQPNPVLLPFLKPSDDPAYIGRLHHFEILRIIGRGGMGIVLEAFDTHLQRIVAIKVLNPEYDKNDVARQRFCREGRAAAAISHEHVVAMHQVAREDQGEVAFLVMQYIEGDTLEERLRDRKGLPPEQAALIGMQIAAGLSAAHEREMVHRDIKPANILIESGTERVKLTDFGLARATDDVRLTKTGMVTGTPLYMSPEQATGATADERSDLFSLGAVMYEMLTGKSPFEAPSIVGVMKRIMDEMPDPPRRLDSAIPKGLSDLTMALLDKNPENRPESATYVAHALAEIVTSYGPISPLQVPAVGGNATTLGGSGTQRLVSRNTYFAAWAAGLIGLASLAAAAGLFANRSHPPAAVAAVDAFPSIVLAGNPGTVWAVDFDSTGQQVVTAIEDGSVRLWDVANQKVLRSFDAHRGRVSMIQYHPTKPIVATSGDDGMVKIWDANSLELLQEWNAGNAVGKLAFSPDGTRIVAGNSDGELHIWHIDSGQPLVTITQPGSIAGVDWSPDGRSIATVGSDKIVRVWDAETLEQRQTMHGHRGPIYNVAFAPQGSLLATVGWGKEVHIWDTATGLEERQLTGSESDNWSVAFCADGTHAVAASEDGKCRIWNLADGQLVATLTGHESAVQNVSLDPVNQRIATAGRDGTVRVWDLSGLKH